jgi:pSer/pThr/pTyr-binding forkhead associated (FHA) protein
VRAPGRAALAATVWISAWSARLEQAWRQPRAQELVLPVRERTLLGRARDSDLPLVSAAVSARHALLQHRDGRWTLEDLGSLNGTFVNGRRIADAVEVRPGDEVRLADVRFRLAAPPPALGPEAA